MTIKNKIDNSNYLKKLIILICDTIFFLIRILKNRKLNSSSKTLLISIHKIGDTVFTIPPIKALLENHQNKVVIACFRHSAIIYSREFKSVEFLIVNPDDFKFQGRIASKGIRKKIKLLKPDFIIDLKGSIVSASLIFDVSGSRIFGINEIYFRKIYDRFTLVRTTPHQVDLYFDAVKSFLPNIQNTFIGFPVKKSNDGIIYIHPLAGWRSKEWRLNNFFSLYKLLIKNNDVCLIIPEDSLRKDVVTDLITNNYNILNSRDIEHFIKLLEKCKLFISNDSGPLQVAAMVGIPTVTIYGPTNPSFHVPQGTSHSFIRRELDCSPLMSKVCYADAGESCLHKECLEGLKVNDVYDKIISNLS